MLNKLLIKRKSNNSGGRMKALKATFIAALVGASAAVTAYAEKLTIATVNNSDMIIMQELSSEFTKKTGHELNWLRPAA